MANLIRSVGFALKIPMIAAFIVGSLLAFGVASVELWQGIESFLDLFKGAYLLGGDATVDQSSPYIVSILTLAAEHYLISITLFVISFSIYRLTFSNEEGTIEALELQMIGMAVIVMAVVFLHALLNQKATLALGISVGVIIVALGGFLYLRGKSEAPSPGSSPEK